MPSNPSETFYTVSDMADCCLNSFNPKTILIGIGVIAFIVTGCVLPVQDWVEAYQAWLEGLEWVGWVAFVAIYAIAAIAIVPGAILTLAGGLAFGLWAFSLVVVGAAGAFFTGRRPWPLIRAVFATNLRPCPTDQQVGQ